MEIVDDDDPLLTRCPLVVEASPQRAEVIWRKFWDYRIWHKKAEIESIPEVMPPDNGGRIVHAVQDLFRFNESDPEFAKNVDPVTLLYPKALECKVTMQLSACPPRLPVTAQDFLKGPSRSIHIQGSAGTKSLAIFQRGLDVEVADRGALLCLNNPVNPTWVAVVPRDKPAIRLYMRQQVLDENEISERAAWERVKLWMMARGIAVNGQPYPQGKNSFPDYRAWIEGEEFDAEMTTVPDMGKWTIKSHYRDLEKRISQVAMQPGETRQDVVQHLSRVLAKKRNAVHKASAGDARRRCMLVVSNWSTHELAKDYFWQQADLSVFDIIMLNELDGTHCVHIKRDLPSILLPDSQSECSSN